MEEIINWFRINHDVFGCLVASIIFLFTVFLAVKGQLTFFLTLLFLFFSLFAGLIIAKQDLIFSFLQKTSG